MNPVARVIQVAFLMIPKKDIDSVMKIPCTGVILAGGQNSRMEKKNKALLSLNGERIIDRMLRIFRDIFQEVIIVTNTPSQYYDLDVKIVTDIYKKGCPLAGIHSGLFHATNPWIFVAPCDLPFLKPEMIETILDAIKENFSVVIPKTEMGYEPLCAAYSKQNLVKIVANLNAGNYKLLQFFKPKLTRIIAEKRLRLADPDLISFFNVNTPEDLSKAKKNIMHGEEEIGS